MRSNLWYCDGSCYNPHRPIIATRGGWDAQARQWVHLDYGPYALLQKKWQWHLLTMLRQTVQTQELQRLVHTWYTQYRQGVVTNGQKGDGPSRYQNLARYLATYKGAIKISAPMTYRQRYPQSTGRAPLRCPHGPSTMDVWRIWHPTYGGIQDELAAIRRGQ